MAIILCKCEGKNDRDTDLDMVRGALIQRGERVFTGKTLCGNGIDTALKAIGKAESIVIGGCWCNDHKDEFKDAMRKRGFDPFALRFVPMLGNKSTESMVLMLLAAAERMKLYKGVRPDNLKPRLGSVHGEMSRRNFLKFPRVRHEVVPAIDGSRCRSGERGCRLCQRKCESGALSHGGEGMMAVVKDKCTGCGLCVNACPAAAIHYPGYSPGEIIREIEVLLAGASDGPERPSAVLFVCEESDLMRNDYFLTGGSLPKGVLPVTVPCLGMLDPFYLMYPVFRGAVKVGLLSCTEGRCGKSAALKSLTADRDMAEALFAKLGFGKERLAFISANSLAHLEKELMAFDESLRESGSPPPFTMTDPAPDAAGHPLSSLLGRPEFADLRMSGFPSIPYGLVSARDGADCTFCGVCEKRCPAEALKMTGEDGRRALEFTYGECVACGECVRSCPERALTLKRELDAGKLAGRRASVLAAETQVSCKECGRPFLNEALTRKLLAELPSGEAEFVTRLCPPCRAKIVFRSLVNADSPGVAAVKREQALKGRPDPGQAQESSRRTPTSEFVPL